MAGRPCFKGCGPLLRRWDPWRCGEYDTLHRTLNRTLNHGKQVFFQAHASALRLGQQSGFDFRLKVQRNGHDGPGF